MKNLILCVVCLSLLGACRGRKANDNTKENMSAVDTVYVFDIENSIGAVGADTVVLNDLIADKVRFVPLESSDRAIVSNYFSDGYKFVATEDYFFLSTDILPENVFQFDSKGNFIRQVIRQGRGPGEVPFLVSWSVNSSRKEICIAGEYKLVVASFDGKDERDITPERMSFMSIPMLNDGTFAFAKSHRMGRAGVDIPYLTFVNFEGQVVRSLSYGDTRDVDEYTYSTPGEGEGGSLPYELYLLSSTYDGSALFQDVFNDTISRIRSSDEIYPQLILKRGRYAPRAKDANDDVRKAEQIYFRNMMETEKYVLLRYFYDNNLYSAIWDKAERRLVSRTETPSDSWELSQTFSVRYILPDGTEAILNVAYADRNNLYCLLEPSVARHFVDGVADDANPVVMIAELK